MLCGAPIAAYVYGLSLWKIYNFQPGTKDDQRTKDDFIPSASVEASPMLAAGKVFQQFIILHLVVELHQTCLHILSTKNVRTLLVCLIGKAQ